MSAPAKAALLRTTLAYDSEWLEQRPAKRVAEAFVARFGPEATF
jgi:hypothetical protein